MEHLHIEKPLNLNPTSLRDHSVKAVNVVSENRWSLSTGTIKIGEHYCELQGVFYCPFLLSFYFRKVARCMAASVTWAVDNTNSEQYSLQLVCMDMTMWMMWSV